MSPSGSCVANTMVILILLFLLIVFYLSYSIQNVDNPSLGRALDSQMKSVSITNDFPFDVSVFYEESESSGAFLANIGPKEILEVSTTTGNVRYFSKVKPVIDWPLPSLLCC